MAVKHKENKILKEFPEIEDLMFKNKKALSYAKKKKYFKKYNKK